MSLKQTLIQQFIKPSGLQGRLAGYIMANRASNIERNHWTIEKLSQSITTVRIFGIDHSETMLRQASKRSQDAIADQRVYR